MTEVLLLLGFMGMALGYGASDWFGFIAAAAIAAMTGGGGD